MPIFLLYMTFNCHSFEGNVIIIQIKEIYHHNKYQKHRIDSMEEFVLERQSK